MDPPLPNLTRMRDDWQEFVFNNSCPRPERGEQINRENGNDRMENKILILFYYITYIYTSCYIHIYNNNNIRIYKMIVGERIIFARYKRES